MSSNAYEILDLASYRGRADLTHLVLKRAYRTALLKHHPDKIEGGRDAAAPARARQPARVCTVDEITTAYKTLADPVLRAACDRALALDRRPRTPAAPHAVHRTGLETVDLDALDYDADAGLWSRPCRCGDKQGFVAAEAELEKHVDEGELTIGCRGCSLWLRVLFGVDDG